jgi:hypothetical protein
MNGRDEKFVENYNKNLKEETIPLWGRRINLKRVKKTCECVDSIHMDQNRDH